MNRQLGISIAVVIAGYFLFSLIHAGFRSPNNTIRGADLGTLISVKGCSESSATHLEDFQAQWRIMSFRLATLDEKPSANSQCKIQMETSTGIYPGYFEPDQGLIFFSFLPRYKHGWFTGPKETPWPRPLYLIKAQPKWLELISATSISPSTP